MPYFLVINLPGEIDPNERGERFEEPLWDSLERENLGEIVGGGSSLGQIKGRTVITSCDIEVEVKDLQRGLEAIRNSLLLSGAPAGTTIRLEEPHTIWPLYVAQPPLDDFLV